MRDRYFGAAVATGLSAKGGKERVRLKHYICYELTMPNAASWNGKWSGADRKHYIIKTFRERDYQKYKDRLIGSWFYRWPDGWCACVTGTEIDGKESAKRKRMKTGFCGYGWMVSSIIAYGKIMTDREVQEYLSRQREAAQL